MLSTGSGAGPPSSAYILRRRVKIPARISPSVTAIPGASAPFQCHCSQRPELTIDPFSSGGNYPKFFVSMMKAFFGDKATAENSWGYDWLPKWDKSYDVLQYFEMMNQGKVNGYINIAIHFALIHHLEVLQNVVALIPLRQPVIAPAVFRGGFVAEEGFHHGDEELRIVAPRREWVYRQLRPLAAVALERRGRPGDRRHRW